MTPHFALFCKLWCKSWLFCLLFMMLNTCGFLCKHTYLLFSKSLFLILAKTPHTFWLLLFGYSECDQILSNTYQVLKVRYFQKQIILISILPKNERKMSALVAWAKKFKYYVPFLEESRTRKNASEINRPFNAKFFKGWWTSANFYPTHFYTFLQM